MAFRFPLNKEKNRARPGAMPRKKFAPWETLFGDTLQFFSGVDFPARREPMEIAMGDGR